MHKRSLDLIWVLLANVIGGCSSVGARPTLMARLPATADQPSQECVTTGIAAVVGHSVTDPSEQHADDWPTSPITNMQTADTASTAMRPGPPPQEWPLQRTMALVGQPAATPSPELAAHHLDCETPNILRLPPVDDNDATMLGLVGDQWSKICSDHAQFYSLTGLTWLAGGLGAGALMANTSFDEEFLHDTYAENVVLAPTHEYYERFHQPKILGDGWYTVPVFAVAAFSQPLLDKVPCGRLTGEWGERSLRTLLVGGPPMLALQELTGGSRPGESSTGSKWQPLEDNNGVSGHSFMGAVPFLSAAEMADNPWLKAGFYVASGLPALSRINDDDHYPSQAFLGWWLAYLAARAVDRSQSCGSGGHVHVVPQTGGVGVAIEY